MDMKVEKVVELMNKIEDADSLNAALTELHKGLISGSFPEKFVSEEFSKKCAPFLLVYVKLAMDGKGKKFTDTEQQNILLAIQICQYIYNYTGLTTGLSDTQYDVLYELYVGFGNKDIVSVALPDRTKETAFHKYPSLRGTLAKIYYLYDDEERMNPTRKYLSEWIHSREKEYYEKTGKMINLKDEPIYVFPKWDGVSCIFEFNPDGTLNTALTRGDVETNEAQNITHAFPNMRGKVTQNGYGLKTEILITDENFDKFNKKSKIKYEDTRSMVASILNSDKRDERNTLLTIQKLRTSTIVNGEETLQELADEAFESPFIRCKLGDTDAIKRFAEEHRFVNGLRCDGAVIYIINKDIRNILGRKDNKNRYEVAYKFTEDVEFTELEDIVFQVGMLGAIAPVAKVKPVYFPIKGRTVSSVSLGSMTRFEDLRLRKGDTVKILYDIIPYLVFDSECHHKPGEKKIKGPTHCPICGEPLEKNKEGIYTTCVNPNCSWKKKGAILNYLDKIGIENISYATVDTFYDKGYLKNIKDIYSLKDKRNELCSLDRFGEASIDAILDSIDAHKIISDYQLFGAVGISGCATETFRKVFSYYNIDDILKFSLTENTAPLCEIPGIKQKIAKKLLRGVAEKDSELRFLLKNLTITHPRDSDTKNEIRVCFTKVRDWELELELEKLGCTILGTVRRDTDYLVVPNLAVTSSKVSKAEKYGVKIITIDNILDEIKKRRGVK